MKFWLLSCEHAGNDIPSAYQAVFKPETDQLQAHRGYDPGAFLLFRKWASQASWATYYPYTRLLIEVNRSVGHKALFSAYSNGLAPQEKQRLITHYYLAYRNTVENQIRKQLASGQQLIHVGVHSFTPVLNGEVRNADVGLLYDPANKLEKAAAGCWRSCIQETAPELKVRMNYPYLGKADGFTTYLRKKFSQNYAGIEFELNQQWANNQEVYEKLSRAYALFQQQFR